jgi:hypothetical protein
MVTQAETPEHVGLKANAVSLFGDFIVSRDGGLLSHVLQAAEVVARAGTAVVTGAGDACPLHDR